MGTNLHHTRYHSTYQSVKKRKNKECRNETNTRLNTKSLETRRIMIVYIFFLLLLEFRNTRYIRMYILLYSCNEYLHNNIIFP